MNEYVGKMVDLVLEANSLATLLNSRTCRKYSLDAELKRLGYVRYKCEGDDCDRHVFIGDKLVVKIDNPESKHYFGNQTHTEWETWKRFRRKYSDFLATIFWHGRIRGREAIIMEKLDGDTEFDEPFNDLLAKSLGLHEVQTIKASENSIKAVDYGF